MSKSEIEITFLGTASSLGSPIIGFDHPVCFSDNPKDHRLRSAILIKQNSQTLVVDCGPDFRTQMLRNNCTSLDAILLTHEHSDHTAGLDDIRPYNFLMNKDIPIYGEIRVLDSIKRRFDYCFKEPKYPGAPGINIHEIENNPFFINQLYIEPIRVMHGQLPILGFKINNIAYITDASYISSIELKKIKQLDILVINALRKEKPHHSQYILKEALEIIEQVKPKKAYLTHISPTMGFHDEVQKTLPKNVFLAYDNLITTA